MGRPPLFGAATGDAPPCSAPECHFAAEAVCQALFGTAHERTAAVKVAEMAPSGSALAQLREHRYADKYRAAGQPIHLIGVEFSRATRDITAFETADA